MVRLATRKKTTSGVRYPSSRRISTVKARSTAKKARKIKAIKRKVAKKRAVKRAVLTPIFAPRVKSLMNNLESLSKKRKKLHGPKDPVAKKLHSIQIAIGKELKKANAINQNMAKSLKSISPSIRGIKNVPQSIRMNAPKLAKFLREHVRRDVIKFLNGMKITLSPMQTELKRLELQLKRDLKKLKSNKIQFKVDPKLKGRFNTLNNNISKFKTKWNKRLNMLITHGNRNVQIAAKALKKQLDDMQKTLKRNLTIINRYAKSAKKKAGYKTQHLFTASQAKNFETKWNRMNKDLEQFRTKVEHFFDQLKAVKLL